MKLTYTFATGEKSEIEVTEEWAAVIMEFDRIDYNSNQRETRRHCSLDRYNLDDSLLPSDADVEGDVICAERDATLHAAIAKLLPEQQRLLNAYYFNDVPLVEIAKRESVTKQAISNRLARAEAALKKILA
jgi:RNA polymerase sigma-70 factor (ECF subfamily)